MLAALLQLTDYQDKVRIDANDLQPGMFVCELDCPWEDTPFQPKGFEITETADIKAVGAYCKYVFIDLVRTEVTKVTLNDLPSGIHCEEGVCFGPKDVEAAHSTLKQTSDLIHNLVEDIRDGHSLDVQLAKSAVSECVSQVLSNPEVMMLLGRLRAKDNYTRQQAYNTCIYSIVLGRLLGLNSFQLEQLGTCGLLHDIGKLTIPDSLLNKSTSLSEDEFIIVRKHAKAGRDILMSATHVYAGTVDVAYGHHENMDGSGYPRGLQGDQINLNCKIVSVADKYVAITSPRPYRPEGDHLNAVAILNKLCRESKLDEKVVGPFVSHLGVYPPGSVVELSSGEVGIVIETNPLQHLHPKLLIVRDPDKNPCHSFINMAQKTTDARGRPYRIANVRSADTYGITLGQYYDLIVQAFN